MTVLSGVLVLVIYVIVVVGIGFLVKKSSNKSVDEFLLSGRKAGLLQSGFSIAATWIWAPALFVSAQLAYVNGFTGWLWFTVPNVLILVVFGMVASKLYKNFPKLVTLPQYMNNTYSKRVHVLYIFQFAVNQICSFGVQLIAGGAAVTFLTGIPFYYVIPVLAITAFIYSYIGGFRASLVTDFVQMSLLLLIGFVSVFFVFRSFGFSSVIDGLGGISGEFRNPFNAVGRKLALTMGIGTALGILAGPFGDQTYYQRVFAQPYKNGKKSFLIGGLTFLPIPILFGILGFSAAGIGMVESNVAMINVALINLIESPFLVSLILLGLLCGLGSTMDSNLLAEQV
jgi:urea-proton symporter